jgi:hypothetical protein
MGATFRLPPKHVSLVMNTFETKIRGHSILNDWAWCCGDALDAVCGLRATFSTQAAKRHYARCVCLRSDTAALAVGVAGSDSIYESPDNDKIVIEPSRHREYLLQIINVVKFI